MISSRSISVAAAVALALGAGSANALNKADSLAAVAAGRSLVVAGASAQRDAFLQLMAVDLCSTAPDVYRATPTSGADFKAYSCHTVSNTGSTSIGAALGIAANQDIVVFYRSEGGSAWGPYSIAQKNAIPSFVGIKSLDINVCSDSTTATAFPGVPGTLPQHDCPIGTYKLSDDANGSGGAVSGLVDRPTQLGTADVEPKLFTGSNSPTGATTKLSSASNVVAALKAFNPDTGYGQVFSLIVNTAAASASKDLVNITSSQATGIFTGSITDWCQISTVADPLGDCQSGSPSAHPITIVRREPGSGTQVAAGVQFTRSGCGDSWVFLKDNNAPGTPDTDGVIEAGSTSTLEGLVRDTTDAIGLNIYKSTLPQPNTKTLTIDGIAPNRANAANLSYPFAFEATYTKAAAAELPAGSTSLAIAGGLITVSKQAGRIPNNQAVFAIPSLTNVPGTVGAPSTAPVALGTRSGASCRPFQPQ